MKTSSESKNWLKRRLPSGHVVKFSKQDLWIADIFASWRWAGGYLKVCRYIKTEYGTAREDYYFHRLVIGCLRGFEIDHINRDKLDNRRENLRLCSRGENMQNKAKARRCTSKFRGVCFRGKINSKNPWCAYVGKNGRRIELGYFPTEKMAALAYDKKTREIWGSFAFQNISDQSTKSGWVK